MINNSSRKDKEFDAWFYRAIQIKAREIYAPYRHNPLWPWEDFFGEAQLAGAYAYKKTKTIFYEQGERQAINYLNNCLQNKVGEWSFNEAVRRAHFRSIFLDDFDEQTYDEPSEIKGYSFIEYELKTKSDWALTKIKKYLTEREQLIMVGIYWDKLTTRQLSEVLVSEGYKKITPSALSEAKQRAIKKILLGQVKDIGEQ